MCGMVGLHRSHGVKRVQASSFRWTCPSDGKGPSGDPNLYDVDGLSKSECVDLSNGMENIL